eukprot:Awhi_evm1s8230
MSIISKKITSKASSKGPFFQYYPPPVITARKQPFNLIQDLDPNYLETDQFNHLMTNTRYRALNGTVITSTKEIKNTIISKVVGKSDITEDTTVTTTTTTPFTTTATLTSLSNAPTTTTTAITTAITTDLTMNIGDKFNSTTTTLTTVDSLGTARVFSNVHPSTSASCSIDQPSFHENKSNSCRMRKNYEYDYNHRFTYATNQNNIDYGANYKIYYDDSNHKFQGQSLYGYPFGTYNANENRFCYYNPHTSGIDTRV